MITMRPGSYTHQLVKLLSFTGEYPVRSLRLLGNDRAVRALVHRLTSVQVFRNPQTGLQMTCRLLRICPGKSIRLRKQALPILDWIHPEALGYYLNAFWNHRFPGDTAHRERNHRVAEAAAVCMTAGAECRPYVLPPLQNNEIRLTIPDGPSFYLARDLKKIGGAEQNKTMFTRLAGAFYCSGGCCAVYNTRGAVMKWNGMGEFKTLHSLTEIGRMNASLEQVDAAVLLGASGETALCTLLESDKSRRPEFRFDSIYSHIYFIPMSDDGILRLRMLMLPDWREKLLNLLFETSDRSFDRGHFEYDAYVNGVYVLSHLDGDLARLVRFREALEVQDGRFEVLCFPDEASWLREYLDLRVRITAVGINAVADELGLERRKSSEG
ncbi:MAG: hypothetical protein QM689_07360 [Oscillospiraceae bacterium]